MEAELYKEAQYQNYLQRARHGHRYLWCPHCGRSLYEHGDRGKCLFEATSFPVTRFLKFTTIFEAARIFDVYWLKLGGMGNATCQPPPCT